MIETEIIGIVAQTGAAGVIGLLWLAERRGGAERDRQVSEAHARLEEDRSRLSVLAGLVESNTRALTMLEASQSRLATAIERAGYVRRDRVDGLDSA